jgi:hypothetical protein
MSSGTSSTEITSTNSNDFDLIQLNIPELKERKEQNGENSEKTANVEKNKGLNGKIGGILKNCIRNKKKWVRGEIWRDFVERESNEPGIMRYDKNGETIAKGMKFHVTFKDSVIEGESLAEVKDVESYKRFNTLSTNTQACGCACIIF